MADNAMVAVDDRTSADTTWPGETICAPDAAASTLGATRYVPVEELGRGGLGVVHRAYDPKLRREVAVKRLHASAVEALGPDELVHEARAMAKLSHPNVVAVFDVELTPNGDVILVMEYVSGGTLRSWVRRRRRSWRDVVQMYTAAGRGLSAAHEAGLLHRDFKPSNVLVASGASIVKVGDFGLAKLLEPRPSSETVDSLDGVATVSRGLAGTPRYMAPEQLRGEPATAASDQYSFCVALWEALCGTPPFSGRDALPAKESGPPRWPRSGVPRGIRSAIARGLSPRPDQRWPSMQACVEALEHGAARRRWGMFAGVGGLLVLATIVGIRGQGDMTPAPCSGASDLLSGTWDEARARQIAASFEDLGSDFATSVWKRTSAELDTYTHQWRSAYTEACKATKVRQEQTEADMDLRIACLRRAAVELRSATATLSTVDEKVVDKAHELIASLPPVSRCADLEALRAESEPPLPAEQEVVAQIRESLAGALAEYHVGRYDRARARVESAKRLSVGVEYGPVKTEIYQHDAIVAEAEGRIDQAEISFRRVLASAPRWGQFDHLAQAAATLAYIVGYQQGQPERGLQLAAMAQPLVGEQGEHRATLETNRGLILERLNRYEEAEAAHRLAVKLAEATFGPSHTEVSTGLNNLAIALRQQGRSEDAVRVHRRALEIRVSQLGPDHPDVAASRKNIAVSLVAQGLYEEAELEVREALRIQQDVFGPDDPFTFGTHQTLSVILARQGRLEAAEQEMRRAIELRRASQSPHASARARQIQRLEAQLVNLLRAQHRLDEAETLARAVLSRAQRRDRGQGEIGAVVDAMETLAEVLNDRRRFDESEALYRRALQLSRANETGLDEQRIVLRYKIAAQLVQEERFSDAIEAYRQALEDGISAFGAEDPRLVRIRSGLAAALASQGRSREAVALAEQAWMRAEDSGVTTPERALAAFALARALWARDDDGDRKRAVVLARRCVGLLREEPKAADSPLLARVEAWIDEHA
jgi:tetratricopeptide (TPR) repeat protein